MDDARLKAYFDACLMEAEQPPPPPALGPIPPSLGKYFLPDGGMWSVDMGEPMTVSNARCDPERMIALMRELLEEAKTSRRDDLTTLVLRPPPLVEPAPSVAQMWVDFGMLLRNREPFVITTIDPGPAPLELTVVSSEHPKAELKETWRIVQDPRLVELYPERRVNRRGRTKKHRMRTRRERESRSCHPYVTNTRSGR